MGIPLVEYISLQGILTFPSIKIAISSTFAIISAAVGYPENVTDSLLVLMLTDTMLEFVVSLKAKTFRIKQILQAVGKFAVYFFVIFLCLQVDKSISRISSFISNIIPIHDIVIAFFCIHESLSCCHHLNALGCPLPKWLVDRLEFYKHRIEDSKIEWDGVERRKTPRTEFGE